jgi:hypothetical protein
MQTQIQKHGQTVYVVGLPNRPEQVFMQHAHALALYKAAKARGIPVTLTPRLSQIEVAVQVETPAPQANPCQADETMPDTQRLARQSGYAAAMQGATFQDNEFPAGTLEARQWAAGFRDFANSQQAN